MVEDWLLLLQSLVGKAWNLIIRVLPPLPPPVDSSPCLMISQTSSSSWKLFRSLHNDFYYLDFPELVDANIHCSKYGWLLMSRDKCPLFFFNPFTKVKFDLPPTRSSFLSACFTSPPTSPDCFIFGILEEGTISKTVVTLIKFGDRRWRLGRLGNGRNIFWPSNCPPLFHRGIYYCLDYKSRDIRALDSRKKGNPRWLYFGNCHETTTEKEEDEDEEEEEEEEEEEYEEEDKSEEEDKDDEEEEEDDENEEEDEDEEEEEEEDKDDKEEEVEDENEEEDEDEEEEEEEDKDDEEEEVEDEDEEEEENEDDEEEEDEEGEVIHESYMVEVEGDIWGVFVRNDNRRVNVKKLDLSKMRWSKLESLGDKCVYVSTAGSFAETCGDSELANKIYFNKFYGKSGIVYSLSSGMYHSVDGNFASKQAYNLTQVESGAWIKPTLLL